ncbi:hypothetical protein Plim_3909 [Planctopirus limnophila DSM 3776]|uniref:Cell division protein FtsQ n=1 Tax=Planctopirus limnophila (strain ATCC 43296 / DSM 3776 / IFAM 1008 / Mu 290) TaxID=521674 RepID=D5SX98_PLAL2|nr:hypothetical protein [Planctopirus limnophila]ADG69720.1 hypothetical protein Plim_3909 [Planctopirus limnophila DSM 3776]
MMTPASEGNSIWMRLFRPRVLFVLALSLAAVAMLPTWLKRLPRLETRTDYRVTWSQIELPPGPKELPVNLPQQLEQMTGVESLSLFDERAAEKIAWALSKHPWVQRVDEVRLAFPAKATVRLTYREPVAIVERPQGMYPIAHDGVLLPAEDFRTSSVKTYPQIRGIHSSPQGAAGTVWGDPVVESAARLAELLAADWERLGLKAIVPATTAEDAAHVRSWGEVSRSERRREVDGFRGPAVLNDPVAPGDYPAEKDHPAEFVIFTHSGSQIEWGRAPGDDQPGEPTAAQKLGRLNRYVSEIGELGSGYAIDLRHWHEISRRPMTAGRGVPQRR